MRKRIATAAVLSVGALTLSACTSLSAQTANDVLNKQNDEAAANAASSNIDGDNTEVAAGDRVKFQAKAPWVLESVSVSGTSGNDTVGVAFPGKKWISEPLVPGQMSTYAATMRNQTTGDVTTVVRKAIAGPGLDFFSADLSPSGETYGVGIVPKVTFSQEVPQRDRKALTDRFTVTSQKGTIEGGWRWTDSDTALFRPKPKPHQQFWPANQNVTIKGDLHNAMISATGDRPASWGEKPVSTKFRTGREMIININSDSHSAVVRVNGKIVHEMGVSMGKDGYTTRSGIKTLTDKHEVQRMTNEGVTTEEVYDLQVPYAMRMTDTGEFLHAAPWNGNIGYANTSHGCTNLEYSDAVWVYDRMLWGDPVITTGTGRDMEDWNGEGAVWNIPWKQWTSTSGPLY